MIQRPYFYDAVVKTTKRANLLKVPHQDKPVRVPKQDTKFEIDYMGRKVVWVEDRVADFIGLVDEVTL
jgi:RNase P/RNase MRP subunit p29